MVSRFGLYAIVSVLCLFLCTSQSFALTPKTQKGVKTLQLPTLDRQSPEWFTPFDLGNTPEDIAYWKGLLPEQDRRGALYIVIPTLGLISPVISVPENSSDFKAMQGGQEIDINKYLVNGVMQYPGSAHPDQEGNIVIFGHSNFYKNHGVRYSSIFADIMNVDAIREDEIWLYALKDDGIHYELYKYSIEDSYETKPTDVAVLEPNGGKELTVLACTNGLAGRWILKARQLENSELLVPGSLKTRLWSLQERFDRLNPEDQQAIREKINLAIATKHRDAKNVLHKKTRQMRIYLLNYLTLQFMSL